MSGHSPGDASRNGGGARAAAGKAAGTSAGNAAGPAGTINAASASAPGTKPSMLADLEAGRRLELEAMSGTVVRYARETGVPTPVHWAIYAALKPSIGGAV